MKSYKPRRQSRRWLDEDCPRGVLAIYDNRGQSVDRYTVFYAEPLVTDGQVWVQGRAMSENPFFPTGVGLFIEYPAHQVAAYRYRCKHQAARWSSLPDMVQRCVRMDLVETHEEA